MDAKALAQAIFQAILESLADQVVARLRARRQTALVLFTGTDLGLAQAAAAIQTLRREGWTLRLVFSEAAVSLMLPERLRGLGAQADPAGAGPELDALLAGCGSVLVPALSVNAAAKVAWGFRDCLASRLLARALELGLPVIAATDGCCPDDPERAISGFRVTDAYRSRLRTNLEALGSYGIRLVSAEALADTARGLLAPEAGPARPAAAVAAVPARPAGACRARAGQRAVFSRSDAAQCRAGELRLGRDVLVTPLAADELERRNVHLILT